MASPWVSVTRMFAEEGTPFDGHDPRTYTAYWRVVVDSKSVTSASVCFAPGLPITFSPFVTYEGITEDPLAWCIRKRGRREHEDDWQNWIVTCEYSTDVPRDAKPGDQNQPGHPSKPEDQPPEWEWDWNEEKKAPQRDLDGKPYTSSSKTPLVPSPVQRVGYAVLIYSRNETGFRREIAQKYAYVVNKDTFLGAKPGQVLCYPPKGKIQNKGQTLFYRVSYRFEFINDIEFVGGGPVSNFFFDGERRELTWQPEYVDMSAFRLQTSILAPFYNQPVPIFRSGKQVTHPVLLDGQGQPAKPGDDGLITPTFLKFRQLRAMDLGELLIVGVG